MSLKKALDLFISLLIFWFLLTLNFNFINLIIGIFVSLIVTFFSYNIIYKEVQNFNIFIIIKIIRYLSILIFHIYKSSIFYIKNILSKDCHLTVIEVKLDTTNPLLISIIANSITLTPGTFTIDYIDNTLIVLALISPKDSKDKIINDIKKTYESNLK